METWNKSTGFWDRKYHHQTFKGPYTFHIPKIGDFIYGDSLSPQITRFELCEELAESTGFNELYLDDDSHQRFINIMKAKFTELDTIHKGQEREAASELKEQQEAARNKAAALLANIE